MSSSIPHGGRVERLDAWPMCVETAGPTALTALRAEAGLPELSAPADDLAALEDEELDPEEPCLP
jgi:hypothetical protein